MSWEPIVAALSVIATVFVGLFSLNRQHRSTLEAQREHLRRSLQLDVYRELSGQIGRAEDAVSKASVDVRILLLQLEAHLKFPSLTDEELVVSRADLLKGQRAASAEITSLLQYLDRYEMVCVGVGSARANISQTRAAMGEVIRDLLAAASPYLWKSVPRQNVTADSLNGVRQQIANYMALCDAFNESIAELQVETQNVLLGDLFGRRLKPRPTVRHSPAAGPVRSQTG